MELTLNNKQRYERTLTAYGGRKDIGGVAFICRNGSIIKALQRAKAKTYLGDTKVDYMNLDLWKEKPDALTRHLKKYLCSLPAPTAG